MASPSLGMNISGVGRTVRMVEGVRDKYGTQVAYIVGVGAEYGAYVEFGTSKMSAQPYLMPATRHVLRAEFDSIEEDAESIEDVVRLTALEIEKFAKFGAPVDTGNLQNSIEARPAEVLG